MEEIVVHLPAGKLNQLAERCWTAASKLESQVARNPDLPAGYRQHVSEAFESLRWLYDEMKKAGVTGDDVTERSAQQCANQRSVA